MSDFMRLELGAQSRAANLVARGIQDVMLPVDNLARVVGESAQGFRGQSAGALGQALKSWFEVADRLPGILGRYAGDLATVDETTGASDAAGMQSLTTGGAGLGTSGLNMGPSGE